MNNKKLKHLLAIDTSTQACSVAVAKNSRVVARRFVVDRQAHSQQLLGMIHSALIESEVKIGELDAIVCSLGPGTFTGIRIGVGVAKGLAYGQDLPIVPVSSLLATALTAIIKSAKLLDALIKGNTLLVINDARMGEVYSARYQLLGDKLVPVGDEALITVENMPIDDNTFIVGTGIVEYQAVLSTRISDSLLAKDDDGHIIDYPHASAMLKSVFKNCFDIKTVTADALRPNYLRNKVV